MEFKIILKKLFAEIYIINVFKYGFKYGDILSDLIPLPLLPREKGSKQQIIRLKPLPLGGGIGER